MKLAAKLKLKQNKWFRICYKCGSNKGIGYGCDEAAKSLIIKSEFEPAIENGKVVESTVKIIIPFILEN